MTYKMARKWRMYRTIYCCVLLSVSVFGWLQHFGKYLSAHFLFLLKPNEPAQARHG